MAHKQNFNCCIQVEDENWAFLTIKIDKEDRNFSKEEAGNENRNYSEDSENDAGHSDED